MYIKIMKISKVYKKAYADHYSIFSIVLIVLLELDTQVINLISHRSKGQRCLRSEGKDQHAEVCQSILMLL